MRHWIRIPLWIITNFFVNPCLLPSKYFSQLFDGNRKFERHSRFCCNRSRQLNHRGWSGGRLSCWTVDDGANCRASHQRTARNFSRTTPEIKHPNPTTAPPTAIHGWALLEIITPNGANTISRSPIFRNASAIISDVDFDADISPSKNFRAQMTLQSLEGLLTYGLFITRIFPADS